MQHPSYARSSCQHRHQKPSRTRRIRTASIRPRIGLDIARTLSFSNARSRLMLSVASAATLVDPRSLGDSVMRTFVLLGTFEATLPSSTPAHSPIVACVARWLSTTRVGFTSAAKAPANMPQHLPAYFTYAPRLDFVVLGTIVEVLGLQRKRIVGL